MICPEILVPDNLRNGATTQCRYEPGGDSTWEEMAARCGAVVIPACARCPEGNARAEASVLQAQRLVLATLRNRTFLSLAELYRAMRSPAGEVRFLPSDLIVLPKAAYPDFAVVKRSLLIQQDPCSDSDCHPGMHPTSQAVPWPGDPGPP